ncbi:MIOREX complex component 2 [Nakaseomyces glabratus]|uniref:MIOREX complex component 2 n=1 Tax=Candida glabrata TaxID=5478 RepID=A0A0W0CPE7_CANGB|nr:MIOREX complex component 2 [Nakaseomyces glabratus]KTB05542.1 MIOREX complex component 2 [Nakaseomyces glabratus]KTB06112.1 MIOREX complex component 2 [Nakaseomyces glabratus]KTB13157.1 MIOREX complex component 2 [Nakaseomyces glabratus]
MQSLLVFGGNGFLGKRICQEAIRQGLKVTSISRSGQPPSSSNAGDLKWIEKVNWKSADIFEPDSYAGSLREADHVVHSMGILLENENYKKLLNGGSFELKFGANPLEKTDSGNFTYERMNKESVLILAKAFDTVKKANPRTSLSYISADNWNPIITDGYINSKREAERELLKFKSFRTIVARPGFMYDENRNASDKRHLVQSTLDFFNWTNKTLLGNSIRCVNNMIRPTISAQQVSRALIAKINDPSFSGILHLEDLLKN